MNYLHFIDEKTEAWEISITPTPDTHTASEWQSRDTVRPGTMGSLADGHGL